jgi:3-keto-disaccharide hydrolase
MTHITPGKKRIIANLRSGDDLKAFIKNNEWNTLHTTARGNRLTNILNSRLMAEAVDDDPAGGGMSGLIGFQMRVGSLMKVEYRNILLKT